MKRALLLLAALAAWPAAVSAQAFPDRPITVIVPFAPGASTDAVARVVMTTTADILGKPVIIANRPGATGNVGAEAAARGPADGYNLAFLSSIHAINQSFYRNPGYSLANDFVPVAAIGLSPTPWVVRSDLPVTTVAGMIDLARREPGRLTYGSGGTSAPLDLLRAMTGVEIETVAYRGVAPMMTDLVANRLDMTVASLSDVAQHIRAGRLRVLAVTGPQRIPELPDAPAVAETVPGFDFTIWYGVFAPAATPPDRVARLRDALAEALRAPAVRQGLEALSVRPTPMTTPEFTAVVTQEIARWAEVVRTTGARAPE